jgi:hypothetical protein
MFAWQIGVNLLSPWNDPFSADARGEPGTGSSLFNAKQICSSAETWNR